MALEDLYAMDEVESLEPEQTEFAQYFRVYLNEPVRPTKLAFVSGLQLGSGELQPASDLEVVLIDSNQPNIGIYRTR